MKLRSNTRWIALGVAIAGLVAGPAVANHSWNGYHWARSGGELTVPVADNVSAQWDSYMNTAVADWNQSTVINSPKVPGGTTAKQCNPVAGTIQVCNYAYGRRGWLGLATIWLANGHISQATTKLNDTYFAMAQYNTPAWRAAVTCQEIGHNYGLAHQDEDFSTDATNSCMEYTSIPAGNEHPDAHDYQQLLNIYNHTESASSAFGGGMAASEPGDDPAQWGRAVHFDKQGRPDMFEQDLGQGRKKITHVLWAIGEGPQNPDRHHHD